MPEAPESGGTGKAQSHNPVAYAGEKSDTSVVPKKLSNKGERQSGDPAEMVEERDVAKGNASKNPAPRTPSRAKVASMGLEGLRIYPFYLLADSRDGQIKEAEVTRTAPSSQPVQGNIRHGFVYERVPHITLKSIDNNAEIDVIWDK